MSKEKPRRVLCRYCGKSTNDLIGAHLSCISKVVEKEVIIGKEVRKKLAEYEKAIKTIQSKADKEKAVYKNKIIKEQKRCPHMRTSGDAYDSYCDDCGEKNPNN